jgi:hypothetical protein
MPLIRCARYDAQTVRRQPMKSMVVAGLSLDTTDVRKQGPRHQQVGNSVVNRSATRLVVWLPLDLSVTSILEFNAKRSGRSTP